VKFLPKFQSWDLLQVIESEPVTKYRVTITKEFTLTELLKDNQNIGADMFQPVEDYIVGNLVKT